jgi:hypothetical protein
MIENPFLSIGGAAVLVVRPCAVGSFALDLLVSSTFRPFRFHGTGYRPIRQGEAVAAAEVGQVFLRWRTEHRRRTFEIIKAPGGNQC